jgi:hypothetical protein
VPRHETSLPWEPSALRAARPPSTTDIAASAPVRVQPGQRTEAFMECIERDRRRSRRAGRTELGRVAECSDRSRLRRAEFMPRRPRTSSPAPPAGLGVTVAPIWMCAWELASGGRSRKCWPIARLTRARCSSCSQPAGGLRKGRAFADCLERAVTRSRISSFERKTAPRWESQMSEAAMPGAPANHPVR